MALRDGGGGAPGGQAPLEISRPLRIMEVPAAACAQPGGGGGRAWELDSFEQIWVKTFFRLLPRPAVVALSASFPY